MLFRLRAFLREACKFIALYANPRIPCSVPNLSRRTSNAASKVIRSKRVAYLEHKRVEDLRGMPLYLERYALVDPTTLIGAAKSIAWREASKLPLCLLSCDMHNRLLIDRHFAAAGAAPSVVAETNTPVVTETNALMSVLGHVRSGVWCSVLPRTVVGLLDQSADLRIVALRKPDVVHPVGLLYAPRKPLSPLIRALVEAAKRASFGEAV